MLRITVTQPSPTRKYCFCTLVLYLCLLTVSDLLNAFARHLDSLRCRRSSRPIRRSMCLRNSSNRPTAPSTLARPAGTAGAAARHARPAKTAVRWRLCATARNFPCSRCEMRPPSSHSQTLTGLASSTQAVLNAIHRGVKVRILTNDFGSRCGPGLVTQ